MIENEIFVGGILLLLDTCIGLRDELGYHGIVFNNSPPYGPKMAKFSKCLWVFIKASVRFSNLEGVH